MENLPYKQGIIKLTWIDPTDSTFLKSKMFTNLQDAKLFMPESKGNNHLFFQLSKREGDNYTWKLLPYGKHKQYLYGMQITNNPIYKYGIPLLAVAGVVFISREIINKVKQ
tara:strand:+ start:1319 stop:1651 length:333 start_codon:yes stop_codon:yes gene_type:complete